MYAVIHGGVDNSLRKESCDFLTSLPFDGFAIGGSMGKNKEEMHNLLSFTLPHLPEEKPNHLLGIGDIGSIDWTNYSAPGAACTPGSLTWTRNQNLYSSLLGGGLIMQAEGNARRTKDLDLK